MSWDERSDIYERAAVERRVSAGALVAFWATGALGLSGAAMLWGARAVIVATLLAVVGIIVAYRAGDRLLLRRLGAQPVLPRMYPVLEKVVAEMAIASGLPEPRLYVVPVDSLNALALGRDPAHASLVVTQGLLDRTGEATLRAVVAHEIAHIHNQDTLLQTVMCASLLPLIILRGVAMDIVDSTPGLTEELAPDVARIVLAVAGGVGIFLIYGWMTLTTATIGFVDQSAGLYSSRLNPGAIAILAASLAVAVWMLSRLSRARDHYADATAILFLRDPGVLADAVTTLAEAGSVFGADVPGHLFFVQPAASDGRLAAYLSVRDRLDRIRSVTAVVERHRTASLLEERQVQSQ